MATKLIEGEQAFVEQELSEISSLPQITLYTIRDFIFWWYVQMPYRIGQITIRLLTYVDDQFSFSLLISTFFSPWKRDYSPVGYFIGVIIRILYLPIALAIYILTLTLCIIALLFWVLLPVVTVFFIFATPFLNI
jgi:hypothetical protein